jgi:phospholipid transport system substrate-binding protein
MFVANSQSGLLSKRLTSKTLILILCLCSWGSWSMAAESPQSVIQNGTDQILRILVQYPQDVRARREQIQKIIDGYFDFDEMSALAVGPRWNRLSEEKRQEFTREFRRLLFVTYIGDIEKYASQRVRYTTRLAAQNYVVVGATVNEQGNPISLDYSLFSSDGNWKVYDIAVQGMSLALNYRGQFDTILANGSFNDLLAVLRQRIARVCRASNSC